VTGKTAPFAGAQDLIDRLGLLPHPEGGFYRETYRAPGSVRVSGFSGPRNISTAIYYLLAAGDRSMLHRIKSDEAWHFYAGDPLLVVEISPAGALNQTRLGNNVAQGETPQHIVPAGHRFGACPAEGSAYSLVGCTVAPGFDFADFEVSSRAALIAAFPQHANWIGRLTA
jgi:predicted cupin superfamily sugar epimerase